MSKIAVVRTWPIGADRPAQLYMDQVGLFVTSEPVWFDGILDVLKAYHRRDSDPPFAEEISEFHVIEQVVQRVLVEDVVLSERVIA